MANCISGKIVIINPTQTIASKNGGNPIIKRDFVLRAMRFNPDDGTPELSERNTPIIEIQGEDRVGMLDNFKVGDIVKVNIAIEGRYVKNQDNTYKFFNSIRALRIEKLNVTLEDASAPKQSSVPSAAPAQPQPAKAPVPGVGNDLPF